MEKKDKMKTEKSYHIPALIVLGIVFLGILIASTSQIGVLAQYSFLDEADYSSGKYSMNIGEVNVANEGFLPAKVNLKNYYGCAIGENVPENELYISYLSNEVGYGLYSNFVEIGAGDEKRLSIMVDYYPIIDRNAEDDSLNVEDFEIAIFESENRNYYGLCQNVDFSNAVKVISVKAQ